jgi:hypothetical protein
MRRVALEEQLVGEVHEKAAAALGPLVICLCSGRWQAVGDALLIRQNRASMLFSDASETFAEPPAAA